MPTGDRVKSYPVRVKYKGKYKILTQHNAGWWESRFALNGKRFMYVKLNLPSGQVHVSLPLPVAKEMVQFMERDEKISNMPQKMMRTLRTPFKAGPNVDRFGRIIKGDDRER